MALMGYSGARGTLIFEKNLKSKISCQTPFKIVQFCVKKDKIVIEKILILRGQKALGKQKIQFLLNPVLTILL